MKIYSILWVFFLSFGLLGNVVADINSGLVAYYPFDGNAHDESGNGNSGDVRGASLTIDRHGKSNSAYSFDGIDDYIYIKHDESLNVVGSYSFSFWVNREINGTKYVLGKGRDCRNSYWFHSGGQGFRAAYGNRWCVGTSLGASYPGNEWHHIVGIIDDSTESMRYYLDGALESETSLPKYTTTNHFPLIIGRHFTYSDGRGGYRAEFKGMFDELRIYNRAISDVDIQELYNGEVVSGDDCNSKIKLTIQEALVECIHIFATQQSSDYIVSLLQSGDADEVLTEAFNYLATQETEFVKDIIGKKFYKAAHMTGYKKLAENLSKDMLDSSFNYDQLTVPLFAMKQFILFLASENLGEVTDKYVVASYTIDQAFAESREFIASNYSKKTRLIRDTDARLSRGQGFPSKPEQGFPSKPEQGFPSKPEQGFPSKPEQGFPSKPEQGFPSKPEQGFPSKPEQGLPSKPEQGVKSNLRSGLSR